MNISGIGELLQMKNPKGIYNWSKDKADHGTRPSYNAVIRLVEKGATYKTLFGIENEIAIVPAESNGMFGTEEFKNGVISALAEMIKEKTNEKQ